MRIVKDGGPDSNVTGYFLCEFKNLFSVVLLKFDRGSRENFHSHAFNAWTWFIKGYLIEYIYTDEGIKRKVYKKSILPKITKKETLHRVFALKKSYALSIRGPWSRTWNEFNSDSNKIITFTWGRKIIDEKIRNT